MQNTLLDPITNLFSAPKAECSTKGNDQNIDDPSFVNIDGHPKPAELDEAEVIPGMRRPSRRPLGFDVFMNPVKIVTKKMDYIKGFKFDVTGPASHKFMMSHSWNIQPQAQGGPQNMGQRGQQATYMLSMQYIGGDIDPYNPSPAPPAFILTGRMDSAGKLEAAFMKHFDERTQLRISSMFPNSDTNYAMVHADLEYEGIVI